MSVLFFGVRRVPRYEKDWFSGALAGWWFARQGGAGRVLLGRGLIKKDKFRIWEHLIRRPEKPRDYRHSREYRQFGKPVHP